MKRFYITTTLPYVNAEAHLGHAMEFIRADVLARYKKSAGYEVFFNTGTDEHGVKIFNKANIEKRDVKEYVDEYSLKFRELLKTLDITPEINFVRTTDIGHIHSAQEFWKLCRANGYIYKKNYKAKYCTGCELVKTDSELINGKCSIHQNLDLEIIEEENYFFKYSAFGEKLLKLYNSRSDFIVPSFRQKEIEAFVKKGLEDFSISRLKSKMPWGIEVPDDSEHVMYVWFDALVNYISAIGWPNDMDKFHKWAVETGGMVQICGKDNLRQQSSMWQAMLMSVNLPLSKNIIINGFITGEGGIKMSKSLGNAVNPLEVISEYGIDAFRYFMIKEIDQFEDSPFTLLRFKDAYNSGLANGLGNLTSRVLKMANMNGIKLSRNFEEIQNEFKETNIYSEYSGLMDTYNLQKAIKIATDMVTSMDIFIQETEPFKKIKVDKDGAINDINYLLEELLKIAYLLEPVMPSTVRIIKENILAGTALNTPLFLRK